MDEILLIDKPAGMTSFGVVARLRRVLSKQEGKKVKVGALGLKNQILKIKELKDKKLNQTPKE